MTLQDLQTQLSKHKFNALLITRNNRFLGQDILPEENKIMELTGFSGSAGTLLVTPVSAYLFVDGRYEIQAAREVNPEDVHVVCKTQDTLVSWLKKNSTPLDKWTIAYNPECLSVREFEQLQRELPKFDFVADQYHLEGEKISLEKFSAFEHKPQFSGISAEEKLGQVIVDLKKHFFHGFFIGSADSVSWLLNLRSRCLPDTPVLRAAALVDILGNITVFADNIEFPQADLQFTIAPFADLEKYLKNYKKQKIGYDGNFTSQKAFLLAQKHHIDFVPAQDPCQKLKAVKNPVELEGIRQAHLRDGVAVCRFLHWLEKEGLGKTELDIVDKLYDFRKQGDNFFSVSFDTIAGFAANGAVVHYRPQEKTNLKLEKGSLLLLDSGAQYFDGTTDITRTIAVGKPKKEMIDNFTYVLKGHISLSSAVFPQGTSGMKLDTLARNPLWRQGLDYQHGTGHGVGCFLNVHEGPLSISSAGSRYPLEAGMITSIEPGYYKEGHYGIRIENLVEVVPAAYPGMLKFAYLTLAPIDKRLINKYLLSTEEINWINNYHQNVFKKIQKYLNTEERNWLKDVCSPL